MVNNNYRERIVKGDYLDYIDCNIGISERNREVIKKYVSGMTCKQLAKEYNVSYNRIVKIIIDFIKRVKSAKSET